MPSDEALLESLLAGDVRSFDALYARHERRLFGFIRRHHPGIEDAEDVLHETFLALLRDGAGARGAPSLRAWLFQVARNLCLNRHRSRRRAGQALAADAPVAPAAPSFPGQALEERQRLALLHAAIARLPVDLAEVYQLRASGMSYDEMASVLAIPIGTVKSRMHAVVHRLREEVHREL